MPFTRGKMSFPKARRASLVNVVAFTLDVRLRFGASDPSFCNRNVHKMRNALDRPGMDGHAVVLPALIAEICLREVAHSSRCNVVDLFSVLRFHSLALLRSIFFALAHSNE